MLTAARLREYTGPSRALDLLRDLGYPVAPVDVDPAEWRRGGVNVPWNGEARLQLAARLRNFDLFVLDGAVSDEQIAEFLRSYSKYNIITKSSVVYQNDKATSVSVFDLSSHGALRRFEFDPDRPSTHAVDRLNLLARGDDDALPRIYDRALDRESVTRDFFLRFRSAVADVAAALRESFPEEDAAAIAGEALLLLSRLLFLSFIQEKGWLNGERRFLVDRLEREIARGGEFFLDVLLPLFFGCLNTPLHQRGLAARNLGRIPYLNGGLFEPSAFERRHPVMHVSNELMQRVIEQVFERFDFRIDESGGAGTHVDPEMLGKVFESLMAADERAASGSFYTPKEIVDSLVERAIREWLGDEPTVEKLERITILDPACGSGAFLLAALGAIERIWKSVAGELPPGARRRIVVQSLFGVDVKAEAVRLCELRLWLAIVSDSAAEIEEIEPLPNLDRNILQGNSLLSPTDFLGAARTDIYAAWLQALRAQRDLVERYRVAPHAQRPALCRIIRGNDQRLAAELLSRVVEAAEEELRQATAPRRDLFGRAVSIDQALCGELQQRIRESRAMLEKAEEGNLDFFSFDVHFAHVLAAGGFDVVAGNPPWVRNGRIEAQARRMLADRYALFRSRSGSVGFHQPDLSVAFFERSLALCAPDGVVALLMPAKIANAAYAGPLRSEARGRVVAIDDWSDEARRGRWFDADTFPLGLTLRRTVSTRPVRIRNGSEAFELPQYMLPVNGALSEWCLAPVGVATILRRLRARHPSLEQALGRKPVMGVKTGDNGSFFIEADHLRNGRIVTRDGLEVPLSAVCRCVRGRDLHRWRVDSSHWMLWPPRAGWPKAPAWLEAWAAARNVDWRELSLSYVRAEHVGIKVAWKDLSRGMAAAVLPDVVNIEGQPFPLIPNQTLYSVDAVSLDEAYGIAAVLNSTIAGALLVSVAERAKDAHYRYFGRTVAAMPWPDTRSCAEELVRLSRRAHRGVDVGQQIDELVAACYDVTRDEVKQLQEFLAMRVGAGSQRRER
jgi:hypothetical protein